MPGYRVTGPTSSSVEAPVWAALRAAAGPVSIPELYATTNAHPNAIQLRLRRWLAAGLVRRIQRGGGGHKGPGSAPRYLYAISQDAPDLATPPRVAANGLRANREPSARQKLWRSMRVLSRFDAPMLQIVTGASRRSAEDFINCLKRAGYLRQHSKGNGGAGQWSTYSLATNSGAKAPSISRHIAVDGSRRRELIDRNTGTRIDISPGAVNLREKRSSRSPAGGGES